MTDSAAGPTVEVATLGVSKQTAKAYIRRAIEKIDQDDIEHAAVDLEFAVMWLRACLS